MQSLQYFQGIERGDLLYEYIFSIYTANTLVLTLLVVSLASFGIIGLYSIIKRKFETMREGASLLDPAQDLINEHWMVYDKPLFVGAIALLLLSVGSVLLFQVCLVIALTYTFHSYSEYVSIDLVLDHHHIVGSPRIPHSKTMAIDIDVDMIGFIEVKQGPIGRILNYGTLIINEKDNSHDVFKHIKHPYNSKTMIEEEMARAA
jgi:hypothetical protein